ncbi:MAG: hypothetical protein ABIY37_08180 [Devosia sp.]
MHKNARLTVHSRADLVDRIYAQAYPTSDRRAAELPIWLHRFNWHRPHGSLDANTPIIRLGLTQNNLLRLYNWPH